MNKKVYLCWQHYQTKDFLLIASLTKNENGNYVFKYTKEALKALQLGCFLPIPIENPNDIEKEFTSNTLPTFFSQRMLVSSKYIIQKLGLENMPSDELSILTYDYGRRNSDNFYVIDEPTYQKQEEASKKTLKPNNH